MNSNTPFLYWYTSPATNTTITFAALSSQSPWQPVTLSLNMSQMANQYGLSYSYSDYSLSFPMDAQYSMQCQMVYTSCRQWMTQYLAIVGSLGPSTATTHWHDWPNFNNVSGAISWFCGTNSTAVNILPFTPTTRTVSTYFPYTAPSVPQFSPTSQPTSVSTVASQSGSPCNGQLAMRCPAVRL